MIAQLRIYTINRCEMDAWLEIFRGEAIPLINKHGMGVDGMWTDLARERFIWFRTTRMRRTWRARTRRFTATRSGST